VSFKDQYSIRKQIDWSKLQTSVEVLITSYSNDKNKIV